MAILAALLLLAVQDDPARDLIAKLQSERIDERERASRRLIALGAAAFPELEEAARSKDLELAGRAQSILRVLQEDLAWAEFRKIEGAFKKAKTVNLRFRSESRRSDVPKETFTGSGFLLLKEGNRLLMSYKPERMKADTLSFVSDGATL